MPTSISTTASAASFIASIGVNGTADALAATQLSYLGVSNLRTDLATPANVLAAAADGARIDYILPYFDGSITTATIAKLFSTTIDPAASVIESVEGPNEVNVDPDTFNGLRGAAGVEAEQEQIYALAKADPKLAGASVYDFSVLQGTATGAYSGMASYATYNNVHAYGSPGTPPSYILPYEVAHNTIAGAEPVVITETGAETLASNGVDQPMQARFDLEALLDAWQLGVKKTYLYNLQDYASGANVSNFSANYGLYNTAGTIKESGTALHDLTSILSDHGPAAASTPALAYTLTGLAYYGHQQTFAQAGGVSDIVLWNESTDWDAATNTEIAIPSSKLTLTLATGVVGNISVYDPLLGTTALQTATNANSITVQLGQDPLVVEVSGAHIPAPVAPADTLVLQLSEDAYAGNAAFTVSVDGQQVDAGTVDALHSAGAYQTVTITGHWGPAAHKIAVAFTNDASSGKPGQDRNLYVGSITYDNAVVPGSTKVAFLWDATKTFTSLPAGTGPAGGAPVLQDTVSVLVSDTAWHADAQFELLIDGAVASTAHNVTALHASGLQQELTFGANLSPGRHTIGVEFVNAETGVAVSQRVLYVGGISVDGTRLGGSSGTLTHDGAITAVYVK